MDALIASTREEIARLEERIATLAAEKGAQIRGAPAVRQQRTQKLTELLDRWLPLPEDSPVHAAPSQQSVETPQRAAAAAKVPPKAARTMPSAPKPKPTSAAAASRRVEALAAAMLETPYGGGSSRGGRQAPGR